MKRVPTLLLLLTAVATSTSGCKKSHGKESSSESAASKAASVVEHVIEHPPNLFLPPADIFALPDPSPVQIPIDGDNDSDKTKREAVHGDESSPAPRKPLKPVAPANTHEGDGKAFECLGHDECYFPRMPFYNQANPNFAHVRLPKDLYDADKKKLTGPVQWDDKSQRWALVMHKKDGTEVLNPYYNTWLPMGPLSPQDDGYIGYWHTALCGPTAESMALMAAIAAKGSAKIKRGSWLHNAFIEAKRPDAQDALPNPLLKDHTTLAPGAREMTAEEIQRVINLAVRQRTSPMSGGSGGVFLHLADEFESEGGKPAVETKVIKDPTTKAVAEIIRERFAPTIVMGTYKVMLQPVKNGDKIVKYVLTLKRHGGHFVAVNGFTHPKGQRPELLIYNPVYAKPIRQMIYQVQLRGGTKDGVPVEASTKFGDKIGVLHTLLADGDTDGVKSVGALSDGDDLHIIEHVQGIRIE
jgi:hypothetical protein